MSESSYITDSSGTIPGKVNGDVNGTNVPLVLTSSFREDRINGEARLKYLPKLPSHRYKYTIWHELRHTAVTGDQLKAPRIREGPKVKEKDFYALTNQSGQFIHHSKQGKDRKDYKNQTENWENADFANLSFQDLNHRYQRENFINVLKRLIRVVDLNIIDNGLVNLQSVILPCCTYLNVSNNYLSSLKCLPKLPMIQHLTLGYNDISTLEGINVLKKAPIKYLYMKGNPVEFTEHYRKRVFEALPQLKILDNIPKLSSDDWQPEDERPKTGTCIIS